MAEDAIAKARAIAAKLSGGLSNAGSGSGGAGGELGKRKRWEDASAPGGFHAAGLGLGAVKKKKLYVPTQEHPEINFLGLLIGPRGATQKQLQEMSGAKILIRGQGSQREGAPPTGHPDDDDKLHVSIEGTDEAVDKAYREVEKILFNPEQAMRLKQEQLSSLENLKRGGDGTSMYGPGTSSSSIGVSSGTGDEYQVEIHVPNGVVGTIIGKGGETTKRIQAMTGTHVQIAKESEMKPGDTHRCITVKGTPDAVAECRRQIDEIVNNRMNQNNGGGGGGGMMMGGGQPRMQQLNSSGQRDLENPFVMKVPVPDDKVGIIIGKLGMTIKGIQERTRTQIQIPKGPDEDNVSVRTLSIGGDTKESLEAAQMEIHVVLQQHETSKQRIGDSSGGMNGGGIGMGGLGGPRPAESLYISVPDEKVGVIIGKQGVTIKDIQARTRTRIQIPPAADPGTNPPIRTICIQGPVDGQHLARSEIEAVLQNNALMAAGGSNVQGQQQQYGSQGYRPGGNGGQFNQQQQQQQQWGGNQGQGGYYGGGGGGGGYGYQQQSQQQGYSGQGYGVAAYGRYTAPDSGTVGAQEVVPNDPTAFYNDFWLYATYYGEAAARVYYKEWSPPEGTLPPPGTILPDPSALAAAAGSTVPVPTAGTSGNGNGTTHEASTAGSDRSNSNNNSSSADNAVPKVESVGIESKSADASAGTTAADDEEGAVSEEQAAAAWEAYKAEYTIWYEEHGKAIGADPNPPQQ